MTIKDLEEYNDHICERQTWGSRVVFTATCVLALVSTFGTAAAISIYIYQVTNIGVDACQVLLICSVSFSLPRKRKRTDNAVCCVFDLCWPLWTRRTTQWCSWCSKTTLEAMAQCLFCCASCRTPRLDRDHSSDICYSSRDNVLGVQISMFDAEVGRWTFDRWFVSLLYSSAEVQANHLTDLRASLFYLFLKNALGRSLPHACYRSDGRFLEGLALLLKISF